MSKKTFCTTTESSVVNNRKAQEGQGDEPMLIDFKSIPPHHGFEEYFEKTATDPHFGSKALSSFFDSYVTIPSEKLPPPLSINEVQIRLPIDGEWFMALELVSGTMSAWCKTAFFNHNEVRLVHHKVIEELNGHPCDYGLHAMKLVACVSQWGDFFVAPVPHKVHCCGNLIAYGYEMALEAATRQWVMMETFSCPEAAQQSFMLEMDTNIAELPRWGYHIHCLGLLVKALINDPELLITNVKKARAA